MVSTTREKSRKNNFESLAHSLLQTNHKGDTRDVAHITNAVMYGIINSILAIPAMYGYAVILFSHKDFEAFMPALSKLVIFSSFIHQVVVTLMSSLPFSIGQVQDVGLIFLSTMTTSICNSLSDDVSLEAKVTTSIIIIGIATASLGIFLVIMGKLKLAALASYLPMPVIGGYLAFIGIFCLYAGLALCTGLVVNDIKSMISVFDSAHDVLLCVPGILGGAFLLVVSQRYDNSFILSGAIMIMPVGFFFIVVVGGISIDDARDGGWIDPAKDPATISELLNLFDVSQVHWEQLPKQFGTWISMVFIVAFSSCLDIAAIELDTGRKLDFNHELKTVGWSNFVSGLLGGYTGSYDFSQTIFTFRSKTNSRIVGVFFFAATLIFIAIDLMIEWLVLTFKKMSLREYAVLWITFVAVSLVALDEGMLIGVGIAIVNFLFDYIRLPVVSRKPRSSGAARTLNERKVLDQKRDTITYFEFSGFLFFGSSVQILNNVQKSVYIHKKLPCVGVDDTRANYLGDADMPLTPGEYRNPLIECLDGTPATNSNAVPTEYVVMDFTNVTAMDATAARRAFLILQRYCSNHGITIAYAGALPEIRRLLVKNDIASEESFYSSAESALELCENQLLANTISVKAPRARSSINHDQSMGVLLQPFTCGSDDSEHLSAADQFFQRLEVSAGHEFYGIGESPDSFFFLASGSVAVNHSTIASRFLFGEVEFFSRQQRQSVATAVESCTVFEMRRETYESMKEQNLTLWTRIRDVVLQSMASLLSNSSIQRSIKNDDVALWIV